MFYTSFFFYLTYSNLEMNYRLKENKSKFWKFDFALFFAIMTLVTITICFINSQTENWYQLIAMSILLGLSLLYYLKQVFVRRTGFTSFFYSTYSLIIFVLPPLAYIDGTFITKIFPNEDTDIDFVYAMI